MYAIEDKRIQHLISYLCLSTTKNITNQH